MIRVHSFESMGTFDGPGLRLVIFLQGCNFNCLYCANPDTISLGKSGRLIDNDEIIKRALSEKPFFGKKGGVTFSGGEPTLQAKELIEVCKELKKHNIHICLDTNGSVINDYVYQLYDIVDMVLLDCKHIDKVKHKILTGQLNCNTLDTARYLYEINKPVRLRYVLVPQYSDDKSDIVSLGKYFQNYTNIERLEILPYHTYGKHKYEMLSMEYKLEHISEPKEEVIDEVVRELKPYFKNVWRQ